MKTILASVLVSMMGAVTLAQTNTSMTRGYEAGSTGSKGVVVGLEYTNLTKVVSDSSRYGRAAADTHIGLAGIDLGYKDNYAFGPAGFQAGATLSKGINTSEIESKFTFYKIYADVVYPMTDMLILSGGINSAYVEGIYTGDYKYKPSAGVQVGLEVLLGQVGLMAGWQTIGLASQRDSTPEFGSDEQTTQIMGFVSQLSYTF